MDLVLYKFNVYIITHFQLFEKLFLYLSCFGIDDLCYELVEDYTLFESIDLYHVVGNLKYEPRRTYRESEALQFQSIILHHHLSLTFKINDIANFITLLQCPILEISPPNPY